MPYNGGLYLSVNFNVPTSHLWRRRVSFFFCLFTINCFSNHLKTECHWTEKWILYLIYILPEKGFPSLNINCFLICSMAIWSQLALPLRLLYTTELFFYKLQLDHYNLSKIFISDFFLCPTRALLSSLI